MGRSVAWVLNLDADLELGALGPYQPTKAVRAAMAPHVERLARSLLAPGDRLIDDSSPAGSARGLAGRAFCPTPRAVRLLERAGARPDPAPPLHVLKAVNGRSFAAALGPTLPGAGFVTDLASAEGVLAQPPRLGRAWRVKHAFGMAGRNHRVIAPGSVDPLDRAFVVAGLRHGGLQIEPNVAIDVEYAQHAMLDPNGSLRAGSLVRQRCDARGAWIDTERVADPFALPLDLARRLSAELVRVGEALGEAGYFGPFGIDAYTYRDDSGGLALQPRSEINARYSMGFAVGFGADLGAAAPVGGAP